MKTLNPIEDMITKTAQLYFHLCILAEQSFHMGKHSGAKRTILLFLNHNGKVLAEDVAREFPDPNLTEEGAHIVLELVQSHLVRTEYLKGKPYLSLTEAGQAKVQEIIRLESEMATQLPSDIHIADLRKALSTMAGLQETVEDIFRRDMIMNGQHEDAG